MGLRSTNNWKVYRGVTDFVVWWVDDAWFDKGAKAEGIRVSLLDSSLRWLHKPSTPKELAEELERELEHQPEQDPDGAHKYLDLIALSVVAKHCDQSGHSLGLVGFDALEELIHDAIDDSCAILLDVGYEEHMNSDHELPPAWAKVWEKEVLGRVPGNSGEVHGLMELARIAFRNGLTRFPNKLALFSSRLQLMVHVSHCLKTKPADLPPGAVAVALIPEALRLHKPLAGALLEHRERIQELMNGFFHILTGIDEDRDAAKKLMRKYEKLCGNQELCHPSDSSPIPSIAPLSTVFPGDKRSYKALFHASPTSESKTSYCECETEVLAAFLGQGRIDGVKVAPGVTSMSLPIAPGILFVINVLRLFDSFRREPASDGAVPSRVGASLEQAGGWNKLRLVFKPGNGAASTIRDIYLASEGGDTVRCLRDVISCTPTPFLSMCGSDVARKYLSFLPTIGFRPNRFPPRLKLDVEGEDLVLAWKA